MLSRATVGECAASEPEPEHIERCDGAGAGTCTCTCTCTCRRMYTVVRPRPPLLLAFVFTVHLPIADGEWYDVLLQHYFLCSCEFFASFLRVLANGVVTYFFWHFRREVITRSRNTMTRIKYRICAHLRVLANALASVSPSANFSFS